MKRAMLNKLFTIHPNEIFSYPPDFPVDKKDVKEGPIEGWLCYAPVYGTLECVECEPVVVKDGYGALADFYIQVGDCKFWHNVGNSHLSWRPQYPSWYQSGSTLRFVRKKDEQQNDDSTSD